MAKDDQPTIASRGLAGELRQLRRAKKLSVRAVATQLGWQGSKLSRMETGKQGLRVADVASLLVIYGVTGADRKRLGKESGQRGYLQKELGHLVSR